MTESPRATPDPCPFCGGEPEVLNESSVHCNNPGCEAQPFTAGQTKAEAIAAWNRRATPDQGSADWPTVRAALRAEIDHCVTNNLRMTPEVGRLLGRSAIPASYVEAVIERFDRATATQPAPSAEPSDSALLDRVMQHFWRHGCKHDFNTVMQEVERARTVRATATQGAPTPAPIPGEAYRAPGMVCGRCGCADLMYEGEPAPAQEKELGACSTSRATIGDRTHDRRPQNSNRSAGEKEQCGGEGGRCDATRAGSAELGARGSNAAQHGEIETTPGPSAPAPSTCPDCGVLMEETFFHFRHCRSFATGIHPTPPQAQGSEENRAGAVRAGEVLPEPRVLGYETWTSTASGRHTKPIKGYTAADVQAILAERTAIPAVDAGKTGESAASSAMGDDGWKRVPVELTPDMAKADPYGLGYGRLQAIWSRLLAASPSPSNDVSPTVPINRPATLEEANHAAKIGACLPNGVMFDYLGNPRKRYTRVSLDGAHLILDDAQLAEHKANATDPDEYTYSDVYLSQEEADALPEFDGF